LKIKCRASTLEHWLDLELIEEALKVNVSHKLKKMMALLANNKKVSKKDFTNLWFAIDLVELSQAHIRYVTFWFFKNRLSRGDIKCAQVLKNLEYLCMLYGLH
jgi:hypothetical protein